MRNSVVILAIAVVMFMLAPCSRAESAVTSIHHVVLPTMSVPAARVAHIVPVKLGQPQSAGATDAFARKYPVAVTLPRPSRPAQSYVIIRTVSLTKSRR